MLQFKIKPLRLPPDHSRREISIAGDTYVDDCEERV